MKRKAIVGIVLIIGSLLMLVAPASSNVIPRKAGGVGFGDYPPVGCQASLSSASASPGESVDVQALCFKGEVQFFFGPSDLDLGRVQANNNGLASLSFVVPNVPIGDYVIKVSGTGQDGVAMVMSVTLAVVAPRTSVAPASRGGILAFTGTDVGSLIRTALVIVAVGVALLLSTRRGRRLVRVAH